MSSIRWRRQPNWYIDGSNVSGLASDRNDGHDATHPIRHWETMYRRLGKRAYLRDLAMNINVMSSLQSGDCAFFDYEIGDNCTIQVTGTRTTAGLPSGTMTTYVDVNRTVGAETMPKITDTALGAGGFSSAIGKLTRIPSGPRAGTSFFTVKDLGSKTVRMTTPVTTDAPTTFAFTTRQVPVTTDPYQVYDLPVVPVGIFEIHAAVNKSVIDGNFTWFSADSIDLNFNNGSGLLSRGPYVGLTNCIVRSVFIDSDFLTTSNTLINGSFQNYGPFLTFQGGGVLGTFTLWGGVFLAFDYDFLCQGPSSTIPSVNTGCRAFVGTMAFFDVNRSRCFSVTENGFMDVEGYIDAPGGVLWGTNNTGPVEVFGNLTSGVGGLLQVNKGLGLGREVIIGGTNKLWDDMPYTENASAGSVVMR